MATFADNRGGLNGRWWSSIRVRSPGTPSVELAFDGKTKRTTRRPGSRRASPAHRTTDATGLYEGRRWVVASFYFSEDAARTRSRRVRLAFVDITDPTAPEYRFVLLVVRRGSDVERDPIHAGGMPGSATTYVADTFHGLRGLRPAQDFLRADPSEDVIGLRRRELQGGRYDYAIPEVGAYEFSTPCTP